MNDYAVSASALNAFGTVMQATANNIANVATNGYKAQVVQLESGPLDRGVLASAVYRDMTPGPAVIYNLSEQDVRSAQNAAAQGMRDSQENYDTAQAQDVTRSQQADTAASWYSQEIRAGQDARVMVENGYIEGSNTELPREFANLALTETAYSANAAAIRAFEEQTGALLDIIT